MVAVSTPETSTALPAVMTVQQAADAAGLSHKTIRNWVTAGRLQAYRVGPRAIRVDRDSLLALMSRPAVVSPEAIRNGERPVDDPAPVDTERSLAAAKIADYIERVLAAAPPLNDEQRTRLAELLRPARQLEAEGAA